MYILSKKYDLIINLKDKDFLPHDISDMSNKMMEKDLNGIYNINWELPCIESYLLLDYIKKNDKVKVHDRLKKYFTGAKNKGYYLSGLKNALKNVNYIPYGNFMWNKALDELGKENPDYNILISVIRGHSWINMFKRSDKLMKSTDFENFDQIIKDLLNITIRYIYFLYYIHK